MTWLVHMSDMCHNQHSDQSVCVSVCSGGTTVFAARDKRLCCRPRQSHQFCNQGIFQDFGHGGVNQPLGSPTLPFVVPFPPLSPSHTPISYPLHSPLQVGPWRPARGAGEGYKLPQRGLRWSPNRNCIWCILALKSYIWLQQILKIFLRIKWPNFMQKY